jgi:hypothetical protein
MSHTNNATPAPLKIVLEVVTEGPLVVGVWSRPAPWAGIKPFRSEFEFPHAGEYGASFELQLLYKQSNTAEACNYTPPIYEDSAVIDSPSNKVVEGGHSDPCLSVSNQSTKRSGDTNDNRITSCQPSTPPSTSALPGSPAPSTVADSDGDPPPPSGAVNASPTSSPSVAANLVAGRLGSSSRLGKKREHDESSGSDGGGSEEDNTCKRRCVPDSQKVGLSI